MANISVKTFVKETKIVFVLLFLSLFLIGINMEVYSNPFSFSKSFYDLGLGINEQTQVNNKLFSGYSINELRSLTKEAVAKVTELYCNEEGKTGSWYYDASDLTSVDNIGTCIVTDWGGRIKRRYDNEILASWFNIKEGQDNTNNFVKMLSFLASNDRSLKVVFAKGVFPCKQINVPNLANKSFVGQSLELSKVVNSDDKGLFNFNDLFNVSFEGIDFVNTKASNDLDYLNSIFQSYNKNTQYTTIKKCGFSYPNANNTTIGFLTNWNNLVGGKINNLKIIDCYFHQIGQAAICVGNRSITVDKYELCKDVEIINNRFEHTGLSGSYGFALTLDGVGKDVKVNNNKLYDCFGIGIENTGFIDSEFKYNTFDGFLDGRDYKVFSFSDRVISNVQVIGNKMLSSSKKPIYFINVSGSKFEDNIFDLSGSQSGLLLKNGSKNSFVRENYRTRAYWTIKLIADENEVTTENFFSDCTFNNTDATANNAVVAFEGINTYNNTLYEPKFTKGTGGYTVQNLNNASNNFVNSQGYSIKKITLPANTVNYTVSDEEKILGYSTFLLDGALDADINFNHESGYKKDIRLVNNTTKNIFLCYDANTYKVGTGKNVFARLDVNQIQQLSINQSNVAFLNEKNTFLDTQTIANIILGVNGTIYPNSDGNGLVGGSGKNFNQMNSLMYVGDMIRGRINSNGFSIGNYQGNAKIRVMPNTSNVIIQDSTNFVDEISCRFKVNSTTQGSKPYPEMTKAQRLAIVLPSPNLHIFQIDDVEGVYCYKSTGWAFAY